ncbi:MAG: hypothetical protein AAF799_26285 [Myxococcota bacterium]
MRSLPLLAAAALLFGCSQDSKRDGAKPEPKDESAAAEPSAGADANAGDKSGIDPEHLAAKLEPDACAMLSAGAAQKILGLSTPPTTEAGTAEKPTRARCLYRWTDEGGERAIEIAWASALQDQADKITKGMGLARKDVAERRLQPAEVEGVRLATWGEHWLTVYANERQAFWVITEKSGRNALEARTLATALANEVVR